MKNFDEILKVMESFDPHYAATEDQQRAMWETVLSMKQPTVVELGVAHGRTSVMLACAASQTGGSFHSVDDFSLEGSEAGYRQSMDAAGYPYELLAGKTQEVPWDSPIDVLFIDAGHDEANVKPDCERWIPFVRSGGYVFFHDWPSDGEGCHWAVSHYGSLHTEGWEHVGWIEGMEIRRKP